MPRRTGLLRAAAQCGLAAVGAIAVAGCLPKDTRPTPSLVHVTATPSAATRDGAVSTDDGWAITFERVVLALGRASLEGDHCTVYAEAGYTRVLSLLGAPDAQKISDSYAVGQCDFGFGVTNADADSLLGVGATQADLDLLRTAGTDKYAGTSGVSLFVKGSARKDGVHKTFAWSFRARARYDECASIVDGTTQRGLALEEGGDVDVDIALHAEALFRNSLKVGEDPLGFDAMAAADTVAGNDDGEVTLDELGQVPLAVPQDPSEASSTSSAWTTLEDFVYLGAAPSMARFRGDGQCTLRSGMRRRD